jgi:hypothetical protein
MTQVHFIHGDDSTYPVPVSRDSPLPVMTPAEGIGIDQSGPGITNGVVIAQPYPSFAEPFGVSSGNAAAAIATATVPAKGGKRYYLSGLNVTASGATSGLAVNVTVTGLVGGTRTYAFVFPAGVLVQAQPLNIAFYPPVPSTINTAVVGTLPSSGSGGTNAAINLEGFYQ